MGKKLQKLTQEYENVKPIREPDFISTGFPSLDGVLGGGFAKGVAIEHWGEPGCGKTTFQLQFASQILKQGRAVVWYDLEHALSGLPVSYIESLGIDRNNSDFIYLEPKLGSHDKDLDKIIEFVATGEVGLVVIDSVAQLDASPDRGMGKQEQADMPKFLKRFLRKMLDILAEHGTILVIINQITMEMNKMYTAETTPGGHNPKFTTWARLRFGKPHTVNAKGDEIQASEDAVGFLVKAVVKKTRGGRPHLCTELRFDYDKGFNTLYDKMQNYIRTGKIIQAGSWFQVGQKKFQGQQAVLNYLEKNNDFEQKI